MAGEVASAYVSLLPSAKGFGSSLDRQITPGVTASGKKAGVSWGKVFGIGVAVAAGRKIFDFLGDSVAEAREAQKVGATTEQIIKSTGASAWVSAKQVGQLASAISRKAGIDDEAIQSGANLLLTFKQVRNEAGAGADIFDRATKAAVDLSAAGFGDLNGAAKQLGKALNDPLKGMTALSRSGVTFTEQQQATIKSLVESNQTLKAQKIILKEVESQVGGTAAASATFGEKAKVTFGNIQEQIGTALLPVLDRVEKWFIDSGPTISRWIDKAGPALDRAVELGTEIGTDLLPSLRELVGVGADLVRFFANLPGPVQKVGIEVGIAALVLPKLTGAIDGLKVATSGLIGSAATAETRVAALGRAARAAAGIGGMVLLAEGAQHADSSLGTLATAGGAAMLGFSAAGPIGGAIGAGAGLLYGLKRAQDAAAESFRNSLKFQQNYRVSLDQTNAAITQQTRAIIYQNLQSSEALTVSRTLGIADRDLVGFIEGRRVAIERVTAAVQKNTGSARELKGANSEAFYFSKQSAGDFLNSLRLGGVALNQEQRELLRQIEATKTWSQALRGVPKDVRTKIEALGTDPSRKAVVALLRQYNLTPKQKKTIFELVGVDRVNRDAKGVKKNLEDAGNVKPSNKWADLFGADMRRTRGDADKGVAEIGRTIKGESGKWKPNMGPFLNAITRGTDDAKAAASGGGRQVGANLKAGVLAGFAGTEAALAAAARAAVRGAINAARAEGKIHSPSRETMEIGQFLGDGLTVGLRAATPKALKEMQNLVEKMIEKAQALRDGIKSHLDGVRSDFASLRDSIVSTFAGGLFNVSAIAESLTDTNYTAAQTVGQVFDQNLVSTKSHLMGLLKAFRKLKRWGLPSQFLSQLFASGNSELILEMASGTKSHALADARLFGDVQSLSNQLGGQVARNQYGPQIKRLEDRLGEANRHLQHLDDLDKKIAKALNAAVSHGQKKAG